MPKQRRDTPEQRAETERIRSAAEHPQEPRCVGRPGIRGVCDVTDCPRCAPIRARMRLRETDERDES